MPWARGHGMIARYDTESFAMIRLFAIVFALLLAACAQAPADEPGAPAVPPGASGPFTAGPGSVVGVGEICGDMRGRRCSESPEDRQYCHREPEAMCGAADHPGTCRIRPMACPRDYNPVCSCDGETFANACLANAAGASVSTQGACKPGR
jgi:hypothetical protein